MNSSSSRRWVAWSHRAARVTMNAVCCASASEAVLSHCSVRSQRIHVHPCSQLRCFRCEHATKHHATRNCATSCAPADCPFAPASGEKVAACGRMRGWPPRRWCWHSFGAATTAHSHDVQLWLVAQHATQHNARRLKPPHPSPLPQSLAGRGRGDLFSPLSSC